MWVIYLLVLGLNIWFGPKAVAVVDECDARAEIRTVHAVAAFLIGVVPVVNVISVFFGAIFLHDVYSLLKENDYAEIKEFNARLKEMSDASR